MLLSVRVWRGVPVWTTSFHSVVGVRSESTAAPTAVPTAVPTAPAPVPAPPTSAPTSASTPAPAPTAAISKERLVDSLLLYANRSAVEVRAVERYRLGNGLLALELNKRVTHWLPRVTVRRDSDLIHDPA